MVYNTPALGQEVEAGIYRQQKISQKADRETIKRNKMNTMVLKVEFHCWLKKDERNLPSSDLCYRDASNYVWLWNINRIINCERMHTVLVRM